MPSRQLPEGFFLDNEKIMQQSIATSPPKILPYITLIGSVFVISFSGIFIRWADAPTGTINLYRMGLTSLILAPFFWQHVRSNGFPAWAGVKFAVIGGLVFSCDLFFWTAGIQKAGAANPTLMANIAPMWVGLAALIFFREKLNKWFWLGVVFTLFGAGTIIGLDFAKGTDIWIGTLFGLIGSFFYASYFVFSQAGRRTLTVLEYFWIATTTSAIVFAVSALIQGTPVSGFDKITWFSLFGLGLGTQLVGQFAINYTLGHLPASIVSPTLTAQPVVTALIAIPLLGENITFWQAIGGLVVVTGILVVHWSKRENGGQK